jgi:hypothetical protein
MNKNTKPTVFVCADPKDTVDTLYTINRVVLQLGGLPISLHFMPQSGDYDWPLVRKTIDEADVVILLVGDTYGSPSNSGESYIHREAVYAKSKKKKLVALLKNTELKGMVSQDVERLRSLHRLTMSGIFKYWNHKEDLLLITRQVLRDILKPKLGLSDANTSSEIEVSSDLHDAITDTLFGMESYPMRFTGKVFAHGNSHEVTNKILLTWEVAFLNIGAMMTSPVTEDRMRSALENYVEDNYRDEFMNSIKDSHALSGVRCNDIEFQRLKAYLKGAGVIENVATERSGLKNYWQLTQTGESRLHKFLLPTQ